MSGNPCRDAWLSSRLLPGAATVHCGVVSRTTGASPFGPQQHGLFTMLQGRCRRHSDGGPSLTADPGEALNTAPGVQGSGEVTDKVTTTFATDEDPPAPG